MASSKSIIVLAMSKLGISGGSKPPRQADLDLGLITLQSLFRNMISSGTLGRARPVMPTGDYTARENDRIYRHVDCVGRIVLPDTVTDPICGCSASSEFYDNPVASCPRPPREGAFVIINDARTGNTAEYIYEGYTNRWISLHDLSLDEGEEIRDPDGNLLRVRPVSEAPLSHRDTNGLAALLATKLSDHFGQTPSPLTMRDAQAFLTSLANRFGEDEEGLLEI